MPHRATEEKINKVRRKEKESNGQARAKEKQQEAQTERTHEKGEYIKKHRGEISAEEAWKGGTRRGG